MKSRVSEYTKSQMAIFLKNIEGKGLSPELIDAAIKAIIEATR